MTSGRAVVFGGTGFLGRRVVARLVRDFAEVRVAARHPRVVHSQPASPNVGNVVSVRADIRDDASTAAAIVGCNAAINAVGLYVEDTGTTFQNVHVEGAGRLARLASDAGVPRLIQISGIGVDPQSTSAYVRARAAGESCARAAFPAATIMRPSVMFGPGDAFLQALDRITRFAPVIPLFGDGSTRLQPVSVDDVAEAIARALQDPKTEGRTIELGGPQALTYRSIMELVLSSKRRRRILVPVPFLVWHCLAAIGSMLPRAPVTPAQIALMKKDNIVDPACLTFSDLGIEPRSIETAGLNTF